MKNASVFGQSGERACVFRDSVTVKVEASQLFDHLDDQSKLSSHMTRRSPMMGGGRMTYEFDGDRGQAVGSVIRMTGSAFGISLFVEEVVTERVPPLRKRWRTVGTPRLMILESYEMGFDISPDQQSSTIEVWISYVPRWRKGLLGRIARILSAHYARWCVQRMLDDARRLVD